jgi:hypothetical protein
LVTTNAGPWWPGVFVSIVRTLAAFGDRFRLKFRRVGPSSFETDHVRDLREPLTRDDSNLCPRHGPCAEAPACRCCLPRAGEQWR